MSSKSRDRAEEHRKWESVYRQMWDSVGDAEGQRMIRRRHAWQHFRLEWPDGTEIGRVRANWHGGTKALSVSGSSYAVKRVGIERRSGSLTEAASGRLVGSWRRLRTKNVPDFEESARPLPEGEPWIMGETVRTAWPGFVFEGGEDWVFRVDGGRTRSTTARLFDPQGNVVVTMRFLPPWPFLGGESGSSLGMPRGEAIFAVPSTPDVMAVTALAFEKFDTMFMPQGG